ncbi:MAG: nuclear transport factor 2 family protein [Proteobacteria bacterium]|nr:nuclear transport factor 2 family protein [Pseudomonadota bacterium]
MTETNFLQAITDRLAIEDLIVRYAEATDSLDADGYVSVFADDAEIALPNGAVLAAGREQIAAVARTNTTRFSLSGSNHSVMRHVVTNLRLRVGNDEAEGRYYVMTLAHDAGAKKPELLGFGRYEDRFVRHEGQWRVARRVMHYDWGNDGLAQQLRVGPYTPPEYRQRPT